jgi:hypothetical protein
MSDFLPPRTERGRRRGRRLPGACLSVALGWSTAALGQTELVRVTCPQLSREQTAEVEARVRASLLTRDDRAAVTISCESESGSVKIESSSGKLAIESLNMGANLREELLGALDRAFEKLAEGPASVELAPPRPDAISAPEMPGPVTVSPPPPAKPAPAVRPTPSLPTAERSRSDAFARAASTPLFVQGLGELWSSHAAWGAGLGTEWALGPWRGGARAGVLTPVNAASTYTLVDWQAMAHVGARPNRLAGVQITLGLGLGWMVVSPRAEATSYAVSVVAAPFGVLLLSRAFRWRRFALVPELGVRLFASERGVKVDGRESVSFGWAVPRLALGVAYSSD